MATSKSHCVTHITRVQYCFDIGTSLSSIDLKSLLFRCKGCLDRVVSKQDNIILSPKTKVQQGLLDDFFTA